MSSRTLKGTVVSTKMNKTAVVQVEFSKIHPVYGRRYKIHRKLKAHYDGFELKDGELVTIQEVAPISKTKAWIIKRDSKSQVNTPKGAGESK